MKSIRVSSILALLLIAALFSACSSKQNSYMEKIGEGITEMTILVSPQEDTPADFTHLYINTIRNRLTEAGIEESEFSTDRENPGLINLRINGLYSSSSLLPILTSDGRFAIITTFGDTYAIGNMTAEIDRRLAKEGRQPLSELSVTTPGWRDHSPQRGFCHSGPVVGYFLENDTLAVGKILRSETARHILPANSIVMWGAEENDRYFPLYILRTADGHPAMDGSGIMMAESKESEMGDGVYYISLHLNENGARTFHRITSENIGRPLAIALNGQVLCAPNINAPITGRKIETTRNFTREESEFICLLINAGPLPPVSVSILSTNVIPQE